MEEWVIREIIDTLQQARVSFLGITGLDSPQEVAEKSKKETAITRRIGRCIDLVEQTCKVDSPAADGIKVGDVQQFEKNEVQCVGITLSNPKKENAGTYRVIQRTVRNNE